MIQEKDFLYRVPVKTAPITTPRGQIRNPEILVDLEGGEFMHGNILDANSTNKLINQSVKDYVTKDLLEAETSARTKGDEDLSAKIKAEQTRAEGKEKELSDKLAIVDGDSDTEGSFRKAIADVVAAAPEDLDTLKEIADKLAGNDDLHTALNQAITEKADASALANEVTRATGAESGLQAAIATKADATALSNYVLTTALNQQVDTLNTAISAKQDAGSYIPYDSTDTVYYKIDRSLKITDDCEFNTSEPITVDGGTGYLTYVTQSGIETHDSSGRQSNLTVTSLSIASSPTTRTTYTVNGITTTQYKNCLATSDGTFKPISDFVLKEDVDIEYVRPEDFENLEQAISGLSHKVSSKQDTIKANIVDVTNLETADITQLRAIVKDLLNALGSSGLIMESLGVE